LSTQWVRGTEGILAGVCKGLAERFQVDVMLVRLFWLFSVLFFGVGLGLYFVLAVSLPRQDRVAAALEDKLMGVAARFALRFDLDVGLVRTAFLLLLFFTGGTFFLAYLIMYVVLPKKNNQLNNQKSEVTNV